MSVASRVARTVAVARRRPRGRTEVGNVFVEFDGVNQYAHSVQAVRAFMPGGSPNAELASGVLMGVWIRGNPPPIVGQFRTLLHMCGPATGYKAGIMAEYVHSGSQQSFACTVYRAGPTAVVQTRSWNVLSWPDGQFFRSDTWSLIAVAVSKTHVQWTRYYNATRVGQASDAGELTTFAGSVQPQFAQGYRLLVGGRTNPADNSFVASTATPGQFRCPFMYALGSESWASIDAMMASFVSAGPGFDHGANGAAGWWPGDGDTYPTWRNRGTAGSAWDLTLVNGSQSMLKAVT